MSEISIIEALLGGLGTIFVGYIGYHLTIVKTRTQERLANLESEVKLLNEKKIGEEKARMIIAQSIDPLMKRFDELREESRNDLIDMRNEMKEMVISINNLTLRIVQIGLLRSNDNKFHIDE